MQLRERKKKRGLKREGEKVREKKRDKERERAKKRGCKRMDERERQKKRDRSLPPPPSSLALYSNWN